MNSLSVNTLGPGKPVHLQHSNLKVPAGTERRVVEGLAHIRFAKSNVFVHPYRLSPSGNIQNYDYKMVDSGKSMLIGRFSESIGR